MKPKSGHFFSGHNTALSALRPTGLYSVYQALPSWVKTTYRVKANPLPPSSWSALGLPGLPHHVDSRHWAPRPQTAEIQRNTELMGHGDSSVHLSMIVKWGHIYADAQMTEASGRLSPQTRVLSALFAVPHPSASGHFGETQRELHWGPGCRGNRQSVSTSFSFPILVSTCPILAAFLLWIINHVMVISTLLLIMKADHLKSEVCANGAHPLPGRSSFIGRISQWLSRGYLELPPQRSCPEG